MTRAILRNPSMTRHHRGRARVRLPAAGGGRVEIYLGEWPDADAPPPPETLERYHQVLAEWHAHGGLWPRDEQPAPPPPRPVRTVGDLATQYLAWAEGYYRKAAAAGKDRQTSTIHRVRSALDLLERCPAPDRLAGVGLGHLALEEFGPRALDAYRVWLCAAPDQPWNRATINHYASTVVGMFRWGVAREIVTAEQHGRLRALPALRKGRAPAPGVPAPREPDLVGAVPMDQVVAAIEHLPRTLAHAVQVHALAGCRVTEILHMRICDLANADGSVVWPGQVAADPPDALVYRVPDHADKTDHHDQRPAKVVYLGPNAAGVVWRELRSLQAMLGTPPPPTCVVFNASAAALARHQERRQRAVEAGRRVADPRRLESRFNPSQAYTASGYRQAVHAACRAAGIDPWNPAQLRHTGATRIANAESLQVAQQLLGHADLRTTRRYVDVVDAVALAAARRHV